MTFHTQSMPLTPPIADGKWYILWQGHTTNNMLLISLLLCPPNYIACTFVYCIGFWLGVQRNGLYPMYFCLELGIVVRSKRNEKFQTRKNGALVELRYFGLALCTQCLLWLSIFTIKVSYQAVHTHTISSGFILSFCISWSWCRHGIIHATYTTPGWFFSFLGHWCKQSVCMGVKISPLHKAWNVPWRKILSLQAQTRPKNVGHRL